LLCLVARLPLSRAIAQQATGDSSADVNEQPDSDSNGVETNVTAADVANLVLDRGFDGGGGSENEDALADDSPWKGRSFSFDRKVFKSGGSSVVLKHDDDDSAQQTLAVVSQKISPALVAGKRIRFSAWVRTADREQSSTVRLWLRVDRKNGSAGSFDNMQDRPIDSDDWELFEIVVDVDDDAFSISLGLLTTGQTIGWIDDVNLEIVGEEVAVTGATSPQRADSPKSPFLNGWMFLAFVVITLMGLSQIENCLVQRVALRFTMAYFVLYSFSNLIIGVTAQWIGGVRVLRIPIEGPMNLVRKLSDGVDSFKNWAIDWTASNVLLIEVPEPMVTGSGDTTRDWVSIFAYALIAMVVAVIWSMLDRRRIDIVVTRESLRIWLRYTLALSLFGYGIAKAGFIATQFTHTGLPSDFQLGRTFGEATPMGLLWTFMAASPMYTFLSGLVEVVAAGLLLFRRTTRVGAILAASVMAYVFILNMCFDVPVKQYSFHLFLMGVLLAAPDLRILVDLLLLDRSPEKPEQHRPSFTESRSLAWTHRATKTLLIVFVFGVPLVIHSYKELTHDHSQVAESEHRLLNRGFRWVSENPMNR
jgi:hypothetical protein